MELFPVFFGTRDLNVTVFGSGETAVRKLRLLAKTHAGLKLVSRDNAKDVVAEFGDRVEIVSWTEAQSALQVSKFAILALDSEDDVQAALKLVRERDIPVNVVDRPELCDFTVPSILDRGSVVAGIATGGAAPVLAKSIRAKLEALMPKRLGALADFAKSFRGVVKSRFKTEAERRQFWETVLSGPIAQKVLEGDEAAARTDMIRAVEAGAQTTGQVFIVGAGPGDPELLTLKAFRIIQDADIVFYDFLVGEGILDLIRRDAERVSVGKKKGYHSVPQDQIHDMMIKAAKAGKRVVRLKGGDPFIFGRGGEELEALREAGHEAIVVPGISSALGCASNAGIPLTHRDHAQSVTFVTGHAKSGDTPDLDWNALAQQSQTIVVYMGVGASPRIQAELLAAGKDPATPVAVIENGTRANEKRVFGQLNELSSLIAINAIKGPALLFIGETAGISPEAIAAAKSKLETAA